MYAVIVPILPLFSCTGALLDIWHPDRQIWRRLKSNQPCRYIYITWTAVHITLNHHVYILHNLL